MLYLELDAMGGGGGGGGHTCFTNISCFIYPGNTMIFNSVPNDTILDWSKFESICRQQN